MKAVVYYRSRPGEPEASALALSLQREAVRKEVDAGRYTLLAEFTEREGEEGSETYPAYVTAVRSALAHKESDGFIDVALIIASNAGIGSGAPFQEAHVEGTSGLLHCLLNESLIPTPSEIPQPAGAPDLWCLYADYRPSQLDTIVYLCNPGPAASADVVVAMDGISMNQFYTCRPDERWADLDYSSEERWSVVSPGTCVLVNSLSHLAWDFVTRYRLTFSDGAGRRWTAEANDLPLNSCRLGEDSAPLWVAFGPPCLVDQAGAGTVPEKAS